MTGIPEATAAPPPALYNLKDLQEFAGAKRVRKALVKGGQIDVEMACYEPGQSTPMHQHPRQDEIFYIVEGCANMNIGGVEYSYEAGSMIRLGPGMLHDARNLGTTRCSIAFFKLSAGLAHALVPPATPRPAPDPA
jgi:quercetin dioxygenase-like cupin family protein